MSDKSMTPDPNNGDTLSNISDMISSAKKKLEQDAKTSSDNAPVVKPDRSNEKPDISFGSKPDISFAPAEAVKSPAPEPKPASPAETVRETAAELGKAVSSAEKAAPKPAAPAADKVSAIADKVTAAANKAVQTGDSAPVKPAAPAAEKVNAIADKVSAAAEKAAARPVADKAQTPSGQAPARPGQPKRPGPPPRRKPPQRPPQRPGQQGGARTPAAKAPANGRPAAQQGEAPARPPVKQGQQGGAPKGDTPARSPQIRGAEPKKSEPKKPEPRLEKKPEPKALEFGSNTPDVTDEPKPAKKGGKLTRKQTTTITVLVVGLILILVLVVLLLLHHYLGLFDRTTKKISNDSAPTYSDVDLSRPDTMDTVTADQKLKELQAKADPISNKDVMNILLIGEDLRDTASDDAGNTDVMMVISVNKKDKTITETSIMRDCYVYFPDYGYSNRINAAYWHGGIELTQKTVEDYLGIKIDRYVLVNFKVFIDIVDTLGGLDLHVTDEEANGYPDADPYGDNTRGMQNPLDEQNKYLGNDYGTDYLKKGGDLHLNGNQALAYARLRHVGNSDYKRTARQRKVIKEMIKKSKKLSIIDMDKLANKIFPQIKTDVSEGEMASLLIEMLDYRNYKVQEFRVPMDDTYTNEVIDGMDVLNVDFYTNSEMLKKKVYGSIEIDEEGNETKNTIE